MGKTGALEDHQYDIPFYAINAYVYCPYRYYLEHVQGIFADNAHITEGRFIHTTKSKQSRWGNKKKIPGVFVASEELGVYGYVDYVISDSDDLRPIEIKKSSSTHLYENDRLQLIAEAVALSESTGKNVRLGVLKYEGSGKRFHVKIEEKAIEKLKKTLSEMRKILSGEVTPKPKKSTKCEKCSLVSYCMPPDKDLKRMVAPHSERKESLFVMRQGAIVSRTGKSFLVSYNGEKLARVNAYSLSRIQLYGMVTLTTPALKLAVEEGIPVSFMTLSGKLITKLSAPLSKNVMLRKIQYQKFEDPEFAVPLAKKLMTAKFDNMISALKRLGKNREQKADIEFIKQQKRNIKAAKSIEEIRGLEGIATKNYFQELQNYVPEDFDFDGRNRRPPKDEVNALLSFVYYLLLTDIQGICESVGLDPFLGFIHTTSYGKPSLALDLMEPFRPIFDVMVINLLSSKKLKKTDFYHAEEGIRLKESARKKVVTSYRQRTITKAYHPALKSSVEYIRIFETESRLICKELTGEAEYVPYRWRA